MAKTILIYGIHSVEELLNSNSSNIKIVYLKKNSSKLNDILILIKIKNIKYKFKTTEELTEICNSNNHQGIVAEVEKNSINSNDITYTEDIILVLDHIQDTQNLGAILRTAEFFKTGAVIIPDKRAARITSTVYKVAEGAVDKLKIKTVPNLMNEIKILKKNGYWITGADVHNGENIYNFNFPEKTVLVMGNEHKGISKLISDNLDFKIKIPREGKTESLNVSVAAGIFLAFIRKSLNQK